MGARYRQQGDMVELTHVLDDGAAQAAGLSAGDKLLAINGLQVSTGNLESLVSESDPGAQLTVYAFRRDELMVFQMQPKAAATDTCELWLLPDDECNAQQLARRRQWFAQG